MEALFVGLETDTLQCGRTSPRPGPAQPSLPRMPPHPLEVPYWFLPGAPLLRDHLHQRPHLRICFWENLT